MVLKRLLTVVSFGFIIFSTHAQEVQNDLPGSTSKLPETQVSPQPEKDYWTNLIQIAFQNDPKITELKSQYNSVLINKLQHDYSYIPTLNFTFQETLTKTSLASVNVLNSTASDQSLGLLLTPYLALSLNQKLPLNGQLSLSTEYAFNYSVEKDVYLQSPSITLSFSQVVSKGQWGMNKDPEGALINEQLNYYTLVYEKQMTEELLNILLLLENLDIISSEADYYSALVSQYESELKTAQEKKARGLSSDLETFYAEHEYLENLSHLHELVNEKQRVTSEVLLLLPDFDFTLFAEKKDELSEKITAVFDNLKNKSQALSGENQEEYSEDTLITYYENLIKNNTDSLLYKSMLDQYKYDFINTENRYAPAFYVSSSFGPNQNLNVYFSDFSKSFRVFTEHPYPVNLSLSIGFTKNFEFPKARLLRKEIYDLNMKVISEQIETSLSRQKNEFYILWNQIKNESDYIAKLEKEIPKENEFRVQRKKLLEQHLITEEEYLKTETKYYLIIKEYTTSFWKLVENKIKIINMCSNESVLINQFSDKPVVSNK